MNMRYFWIRDQKHLKLSHCMENKEKQFRISYKKHYEKHHKRVRSTYLHTDKTPRSVPLVLLKQALQGCVDPSDSKMEEFRNTFPIPRIP